jgi:putative nucleotidyltransferase with HDIG domain
VNEKVVKLAQIIKANGGRAMLVGGCVRDELMNVEHKDWDLEVYGVEPKKLREILDSFGRVDAVGEAFTVYKLGNDLDVALPRRERKVGRGHKGFVIEGDPNMTFAEAARRRDFTINSILKDALTGEIVDLYGGQEDIKNKILRVVSKETFAEDSLRVLRAAQFAARFEFEIDAETVELCRAIDVSDLPKERIWRELEKLLLKSEKPSIGLRWLYDLGVVRQLFPELESLVGVPQQSEWHPEGWVFSALPFESFSAGVAEALRANDGSSSFGLWEFIFGSSASPTVVPTGNSAGNTQTSDALFPDLETTNGTRTNDVLFSPETSPTVSAESKSLVWSFGIPATLASEVVRVVFKISLNRMRSIVFSAVDDFEIVRGIVEPIAVFVMNMLTGFEPATEKQFHNQSMNAHSSVFTLPTGVSISAVVADARASAVNNDVFFYFDLSFVGNRDFVHQIKDSFSSNYFNVKLGDVWYHTLMVADEARKLIDDLPYEKKVAVMLGAICHDFGKPATTEFFDGKWRSHAHDTAGIEPTLSFLDKLGIYTINGFDVREQIVQLVRYHLKPGEFYKAKEPVGDGAFRRLARKVEPDLLYRVAKADSLGRNPEWLPKEKWFGSEAQEWFIEKVRELQVEQAAPPPILMGRHLLELGLKPSPQFKKILDAVYEMQLDGKITSLDEATNAAKDLIESEN